MKKGGSKRKGNSYEIKIARILSRWYDPKSKEDLFWRTAGSGAKATRGKGAETSFFGDITFLPAPNKMAVWIDCKDRKDITFNTIMSEKFLPYKWYKEEDKKQLDLMKATPILIVFKLYRKKEDYVFFLRELFHEPYLMGNAPFPFVITTIDETEYGICLLNDFLNNADKEDIIYDD